MSRRIILTGGGTGGHITPLLAVAHELKLQDANCHITYIGERHGKYAHMVDNNPDIDAVKTVYAGKFRRYHGESWAKRSLDIKTNALNLRDLFLFLIGTIQAVFLVKKLHPDMILLKGGYVGVPVGLAAALWRLPYMTHDSDSIPGLANRITGKWAHIHATGMPAEYYSYPRDKTHYVGVLVGHDYQPVTPELQKSYKQHIQVPADAQVVLITGGSGGAGRINQAVRAIVQSLLQQNPHVYVIHQVGIGKAAIYDDFQHERLQVVELLRPMYRYTGVADVVITRAGANTLAELGIQKKACIVVPNPLLTGGHQLKNAAVLAENGAAVIVDEAQMNTDPSILLQVIQSLITSPEKRTEYGQKLFEMTPKDAAAKLATLLLGTPVKDDSK